MSSIRQRTPYSGSDAVLLRANCRSPAAGAAAAAGSAGSRRVTACAGRGRSQIVGPGAEQQHLDGDRVARHRARPADLYAQLSAWLSTLPPRREQAEVLVEGGAILQ